MRQHLLPDPDAQPTPTPVDQTETDAGWLRLSARLTREIGHLPDRDDLIVQAAPGAGRGSPGCFVPALATTELDGRLLPQGGQPRPRPASPPLRPGALPGRVGGCCATRPATPATPAGRPPTAPPAATVATAKPVAANLKLGPHSLDRPSLVDVAGLQLAG